MVPTTIAAPNALRDRTDALELPLAVLERDRVDHALALTPRQRTLDALPIGGVDHDRHPDLRHQRGVERIDIADFIALRRLQAHVDHPGAVPDLRPGDLARLVPALAGDQLLEAARPHDVGAFANDQRPGARFGLHEIDARVERPPHRRIDGVRRPALGHLCDRPDVGGRRAAAAADDVQPAGLHEPLELTGEPLRRLEVLAVLIRQPCVRVTGNARRGHLREHPDRVGDRVRAGRTVQADREQIGMADRRVERVHRLTGQHGPPGFDGGRDHQRNADVQVALERLNGEQSCLEAARVEHRLEQQQVDSSFEERPGLDVVGLPQLLEGHVAAQGQRLGGRSECAGHEPRFRRRGEFVGGLARQPRRRDVQLAGLPVETELGKHDWRALKAVGGDDVRARLEIGAMHRENPFWMGMAQVLVAPFKAGAAVVGGGGTLRLQHGAHGAIEDQDPCGQRIIELLSAETVDQGNVILARLRLRPPRKARRMFGSASLVAVLFCPASGGAILLRRCVPNETVSGFPVR